MKKPLFTGVCTALVTPFIHGKINFPMLEILLHRQMEAGIPASVICGTTGESAALSDDEKIELIRRSKDIVGSKMKIIAGAGSNETVHAKHLCQCAENAGADGLLLVTPYYNKATDSGLIAHYLAIAQSVSLPIILYNVPSRTGLDMKVSVIRELSCVDSIIGIKEASTQIQKVTAIRSACGYDFSVYSGNDDMTVPVTALGGKGVISVASNLFPEQMRDMTAAALDGDFDTASSMQIQLSEVMEALFEEVNPVPVKAAMQIMGYDCGYCRLPLGYPSAETVGKLRKLLKIEAH